MANKMMRAERVAQIEVLRAQGLKYSEIGAIVGLSIGTISDYITDPFGAKKRQRRQSYGRRCLRCGALTDGSNGRKKAPKVCRSCRQRHWTKRHIIERIKLWVEI